MLNMTINDWKNRIDKQFEAGLFDDVSNTKEITNFEYCIIPEVLDKQLGLVEAPYEEEVTERNYIIERSIEEVNYLQQNKDSRKAAFVNDYDGEDNHCISYFHHYIRDDKHCMNVYVRSMNYDTNFVFDNQTFCLAYWAAHNLLTTSYRLELSVYSYIRVFVFSLHKFKEDQ